MGKLIYQGRGLTYGDIGSHQIHASGKILSTDTFTCEVTVEITESNGWFEDKNVVLNFSGICDEVMTLKVGQEITFYAFANSPKEIVRIEYL